VVLRQLLVRRVSGIGESIAVIPTGGRDARVRLVGFIQLSNGTAHQRRQVIPRSVEPDARIVEKRGQAEGPATVAGTSH
jgi:hypothetical protein